MDNIGSSGTWRHPGGWINPEWSVTKWGGAGQGRRVGLGAGGLERRVLSNRIMGGIRGIVRVARA